MLQLIIQGPTRH